MALTKASAIAVVVAALAAVITPRTPRLPPHWAAAEMVVPDGPRKGTAFDPTLTPYLVEPMNFFAERSPGNKGVFQKSKQIGASTMAIALCGYTACEEPDDVFLIEPTDDNLSEFLGEKFERVREASPAMAKAIRGQVSRSGKGSTTYIKRFTGGSIMMTGASSSAALRGKTRKKIIRDEAAAYSE